MSNLRLKNMQATMPGYYHISSDGMSSSLIFCNVSDYVAGMNRIFFCRAVSGVAVIAFCLMSNHVHFVLYGEEDQCWSFINKYKQLTGKWMQIHSDDGTLLDSMTVDVRFVPDIEYLKNVIVYDIMNPTKAFMPFLPAGYRWSSAGLYFADRSLLKDIYVEAGTLSDAQKRRLLGTKKSVPDSLLIGPDGMIWPGCYTDFEFVERLMEKPLSMLDRMNKSVEYQINKDMAEGSLSLPDAEIRQKAIELSVRCFNTSKLGDLDVNQRIDLARRLKMTTKASYKQISRIVHMPYKDILTVFRQ